MNCRHTSNHIRTATSCIAGICRATELAACCLMGSLFAAIFYLRFLFIRCRLILLFASVSVLFSNVCCCCCCCCCLFVLKFFCSLADRSSEYYQLLIVKLLPILFCTLYSVASVSSRCSGMSPPAYRAKVFGRVRVCLCV